MLFSSSVFMDCTFEKSRKNFSSEFPLIYKKSNWDNLTNLICVAEYVDLGSHGNIERFLGP